MELITNEGAGHRAAISAVLEDCSEALVAVAFLKKEGGSFLRKALGPVARRKGQARVFIGTDFYLTEPDALQTLLELAETHAGIEVFLGARMGATFHPKTYAGFSQGKLRCLVGSANLTGGALSANTEVSLRVDAPDPSPLAVQIRQLGDGLETSPRFERLTAPALEIYRAKWRPLEMARKAFDAAIEAADTGPLDLDVLRGLYRAYGRDTGAQNELAKREPARRLALGVQRSIAALHDVELTSETRESLRVQLQDLMSGADGGRHLWPSHNIFRKAGGGLKHPRKMIDLFRQGETAAKLAPAEGYSVLRDIAMPLPGVGINLVSEVLSTYAPRRFAVVNRNTVDALARLGLTFKGSSNLELKTITPARYAEIQGLVATVRDQIGAGDFPETDAFLNWIFQKKTLR
jgi:HKD family nuclease